MAVITIPEPLREKLGDEATDAFVSVVKEVDNSARQEAILIAEERLERRLTEKIGKVNEKIGKVNERITFESGKTRAEMNEKIGKLNEKIGSLSERLTEEIGKVNERITEKIGKVNERLDNEKIAQANANTIKWMFIFWVSQLGAIFAMLRFMA